MAAATLANEKLESQNALLKDGYDMVTQTYTRLEVYESECCSAASAVRAAAHSLEQAANEQFQLRQALLAEVHACHAQASSVRLNISQAFDERSEAQEERSAFQCNSSDSGSEPHGEGVHSIELRHQCAPEAIELERGYE